MDEWRHLGPRRVQQVELAAGTGVFALEFMKECLNPLRPRSTNLQPQRTVVRVRFRAQDRISAWGARLQGHCWIRGMGGDGGGWHFCTSRVGAINIMILSDALSVEENHELLDLILNARLALRITEKETHPG